LGRLASNTTNGYDGSLFMKKHKHTALRVKDSPGPKPEVLKVEGDWRAAVKKSLEKKRPATGWPK
jgi:hypothetical protein